MDGVKVGDKFILHSQDGHDYKMEIVNINEFREPDMKYAFDAYDEAGNSISNDVMFCGDGLLNKCEKVIENNEKEELENAIKIVR